MPTIISYDESEAIEALPDHVDYSPLWQKLIQSRPETCGESTWKRNLAIVALRLNAGWLSSQIGEVFFADKPKKNHNRLAETCLRRALKELRLMAAGNEAVLYRLFGPGSELADVTCEGEEQEKQEFNAPFCKQCGRQAIVKLNANVDFDENTKCNNCGAMDWWFPEEVKTEPAESKSVEPEPEPSINEIEGLTSAADFEANSRLAFLLKDHEEIVNERRAG